MSRYTGDGIRFLEADSFKRWPFKRFIGVEIEAENQSYEAINKISRTKPNYWVDKPDGSLESEGGRELNSPPMNGDIVPAQIKTVTKLMRKLNYRAEDSCGLHVHVDCEDLTIKELVNVARTYVAFEPLIHCMIDYGARESWAGKIDNDDMKRRLNIEPIDSALDDVKMTLGRLGGHYEAFNTSALEEHGTIEFRHFEGTLDSRKILNWAFICASIVEHGRHINHKLSLRQERDGAALLRQFWLIYKIPAKIRKFMRQRLGLYANYRSGYHSVDFSKVNMPRGRALTSNGLRIARGVMADSLQQGSLVDGYGEDDNYTPPNDYIQNCNCDMCSHRGAWA